MVVILLLLAVWGGVGAWWLLSRSEGRSTDSIGTFRQQLTVLERTGPTSVAPAFRMRDGENGVYGASAASFAHLAGPVRRAPVQVSRRRKLQKRRRDVLYALVAATLGAAGLGFLPGLSAMWWLSVLLAVVLAIYVVVLMQLRAVAADRPVRVGSDGYPPPSSFGSYAEADTPYLLRR